MKKNFFLCAFMMGSLYIFAQDFSLSDNQLLYKDHWVYKALSYVTLESGLMNFASASPLSVGELKLYFSEIDPANLSQAGNRLYNDLKDFFENRQKTLFSTGVIKLYLEPILQPQFFYKTNSELPWLKEGFEREKFLLLPLQFSVADFAMAELKLYFAQNYSTTLLPEKWTNIPFATSDVDANFPQKGYLSFGAKKDAFQFFNLQCGMGPFSLGETQLGSVLFSDAINYPGYISLSLFAPSFKYVAGTHQLETNKYLYSHRLEFRFFKRITLRLVEASLVYAPLDLRYLNPVTIFHGLAGWRSFDAFDAEMGAANGSKVNDSRVGSYFGVILDANPWKNIRLYGIFAMNQFQTAYELEHFNANYIPNGLAGQGGIEGFVPYKRGYFYAKLEGLYTSPWMYISSGRGWSFYQSFRDLVGNDSKTYFVSWVGTNLGPDTLALQCSFGYESLKKWGVSCIYRLAFQGENRKAILQEIQNTQLSWYPTNLEEVLLQTPSGIPEISHRCVFGGFIHPYSWLQLKTDVAFMVYTNYNNVKNAREFGFELDFGIKLNLLKSLKNTFQGVSQKL